MLLELEALGFGSKGAPPKFGRRRKTGLTYVVLEKNVNERDDVEI